MSEELMITQQDLIDWIDRPPSNDDLDLATFISTRLENFYELEKQLQHKENIIKEVREKLINSKEYKMAKEMNLTSKMSVLIELLEILDKDITKKSDYNYEKVEKENKE